MEQEQSPAQIPMWPGSVPPKNWEEEYKILKIQLNRSIEELATRSEWEAFYKMELWRFDNAISNMLMDQYGKILTNSKKKLTKRAFDRLDSHAFS